MKFAVAALLGLAFTLTFCKQKKAAASSEIPAEKLQKLMVVADKRWPGSNAAELEEGSKIYRTRCSTCHGNFEITKFSEKKWFHEIDEMAPKARLNPTEKEQLTRYIISYREAFVEAGS